MKFSKLGAYALILAAAVIGLDQATKTWIVSGLGMEQYQSLPFLGPIHLTRVPNIGVSFGLLQAGSEIGRWALVVFSLVVAAVLVSWVRRADRWLSAVGLGLIIGGAVGNAIDRARVGYVIDFIDVKTLLPFFPWIFNVADSAITVGVILLLADSLRRERPAEPPAA